MRGEEGRKRSLLTAAIKDEERRKEEKALDRSILCRREIWDANTEIGKCVCAFFLFLGRRRADRQTKKGFGQSLVGLCWSRLGEVFFLELRRLLLLLHTKQVTYVPLFCLIFMLVYSLLSSRKERTNEIGNYC